MTIAVDLGRKATKQTNKQNNVSFILFDICGCFDVPGFELSRFYSITATSKKKEQHICF